MPRVSLKILVAFRALVLRLFGGFLGFLWLLLRFLWFLRVVSLMFCGLGSR